MNRNTNRKKLNGHIRFFESTLLDFFKKAGREHLPWRRKQISAYEVWVSEIMLQQTQVSRVIPYYENFLKRFPTVWSLAKVTWEDFLPYYAGLGYYARGRNMLLAAKAVVERHGGEFPRDMKSLEALPGIGSYTASAIASFAFGQNAIAWDTNLRRVIGRFFFGTKEKRAWEMTPGSRMAVRSTSRNKLLKGKEESEFDVEIFRRLFSLPSNIVNAALMDFGSAVCTGKPKCAACPFRTRCAYFREGGRGEMATRLMKPRGISSSDKNRSGEESGKRRYSREERGWKSASVMVTLHENHKKYFSSSDKVYEPFQLPPSHNTRAGIKAWFRERYQLDVSVRPPHLKSVLRGVPVLFVNAQILAGSHSFRVFGKGESARGNTKI